MSDETRPALPNYQGPYTAAEFARLPVKLCPKCDWVAKFDACEVTTYGNDEPMYMPGLMRCQNPFCGATERGDG